MSVCVAFTRKKPGLIDQVQSVNRWYSHRIYIANIRHVNFVKVPTPRLFLSALPSSAFVMQPGQTTFKPAPQDDGAVSEKL